MEEMLMGDASYKMQDLDNASRGGAGRASFKAVSVRRSKNNRQAIWYIEGRRVAWSDAYRRVEDLLMVHPYSETES
jgi:hypothetical protein